MKSFSLWIRGNGVKKTLKSRVMNPDKYIATYEGDANLNMEITIKTGLRVSMSAIGKKEQQMEQLQLID